MIYQDRDFVITIGLEYPIKPQRFGKVYLNGVYLANVYTYEDIPENSTSAGLAVFNRDRLAFDLEIPPCTSRCRSYPEIMKWLSETLKSLPKLQDFLSTHPKPETYSASA